MDSVVKLRKFKVRDAEYLCENWTENRMPASPYPSRIEEGIDCIKTWNKPLYNHSRIYVFAIDSSGIIVGFITLLNVGKGSGSWGICIDKKYQNCGYATTAIAELKAFARRAGYQNLTSSCKESNKASIRLHKKCGFTEDKRFINSIGNKAISWTCSL